MCRGSLREPIFRRVCAPEHHEYHAPGRHVRVVRARVRRGGARLVWHDSKKPLTEAKHTKESVCAAGTHPPRLIAAAPTAALPRRKSRRRSRRGVGSCSAASSRSRNGGHDEVQVEYLRPRGRRTRRKSRRGFLAWCAARKCSTQLRGHGGQLWLQGWRRAVGVGCMHVWLAYAARAGVQLVISGSRAGRRLCARDEQPAPQL